MMKHIAAMVFVVFGVFTNPATAQYIPGPELSILAQTCGIENWKRPNQPRYEQNLYKDGDKIAVQYKLTTNELGHFCTSMQTIHEFNIGLYEGMAGYIRHYNFAITDSIMWLKYALLKKHRTQPEMQIELSKMYNIPMTDWSQMRPKFENEIEVYAKNRCKEDQRWCDLMY